VSWLGFEPVSRESSILNTRPHVLVVRSPGSGFHNVALGETRYSPTSRHDAVTSPLTHTGRQAFGRCVTLYGGITCAQRLTPGHGLPDTYDRSIKFSVRLGQLWTGVFRPTVLALPYFTEPTLFTSENQTRHLTNRIFSDISLHGKRFSKKQNFENVIAEF